jgi:hypothetical protein
MQQQQTAVMQNTDILIPNFAMFVLTFIVFIFNLAVRVQAARSKQIPIAHFKIFQGGSPTDLMNQAKNNIANLFETPVFFYLITLTYFVTDSVTPTAVALAWAYVACRVAHSAIHLTSNFVPFRFASFIASITCLAILWIKWVLVVL